MIRNVSQETWRQHLPQLKRSGDQYEGPCPVCGGIDRFYVRKSGKAFCRQCCPDGKDSKAFKAILKAAGISLTNGKAGGPRPVAKKAEPRKYEHKEFKNAHYVLLHEFKIPIETGFRDKGVLLSEAMAHEQRGGDNRVGVIPSSVGMFVIDIDVPKTWPQDKRQAEVDRRRPEYVEMLGDPLAILDSATVKGAHLWYRMPAEADISDIPTKKNLPNEGSKDEFLYSGQQVAQPSLNAWIDEVLNAKEFDQAPTPEAIHKVLRRGQDDVELIDLSTDKISEDQAARLFEQVCEEESWRFDSARKVWMRFNEDAAIWIPDNAGAGQRLRQMGLPLGSASRYRGALALAGWAMEKTEWNETGLLTFPGGHVDLKTGKRYSANPEEYATLSTAVAPEDGNPDLWMHTLGEIFYDDEEIMEWLQLVFGYMLTIDTKLHKLFYFYGGGGNGKTLVAETMQGIMGDYSCPLTSNAVIRTRNEMHAAVYAKLAGKRVAVVGEVGRGILDKERVQQLTGGDTLDVQFMRQDWIELKPVCKLLMIGNEFPRLTTVDHAMVRRLSVLKFERTFDGDEIDLSLPDKLRAEWGKILSWGIEGATSYHEAGSIVDPPQIRKATREYLREENTLAAWYQDCCCDENGDAIKGRTSNKQLVASAKKYHDEIGIRVSPTGGTIGRYLATRGIRSYRSNAERGWAVGLTVEFDENDAFSDTQ